MMMKNIILWFLFLFLITAAGCRGEHSTSDNIPSGMAFTSSSKNAMKLHARGIYQHDDVGVSSSDVGESERVYLDDYRPFDPVPSSKASIRPGPVQHGTPLLPYIPKAPSPPPHPPTDQARHVGPSP